ncbi:MAG: SbcC/MukB-like Walker B domain-containing protein, partial [Oscillospiraceae bacterium]|nr:SbcC/MukB-like Walker B domain-containing protein [Oscillospiraceae bacterium]
AELTCARSALQYATLQEAQTQLQCLQQKIEQAQQKQKQAQVQQQELEKQIAVCQTDLVRLQTEIAGKPLYDVQQAEQVVKESRRTLLQQQKQIAAKRADLQQMQAVFVSVRLEIRTLEETQIICQEYKELYSMLNGTSTDHGGERISFERYVQTYYFTRILEHANQKLYQLSNGRYQLMRRKEEERRNLSSGLNLDVLDQYTGTARDVKTLSGGETFLASLSLALGLSEAVQQQSGCVQIQAMFIDEGFGSLDETALENAIRLLQQLSGQDCMVGIISHVPALAERFDAQIRVEKTPNGSRAVCVGMKK